jgi:hypothetical protein
MRFTGGAATGHKKVFPGTPVTWRYDAFKGQLTFQIINAKAAPAGLHSKWRSQIRDIAGQLTKLINTDALLPFHFVNDVVDASTTPTVKTDSGVEWSQLSYSVIYSIDPNAWPAGTTGNINV